MDKCLLLTFSLDLFEFDSFFPNDHITWYLKSQLWRPISEKDKSITETWVNSNLPYILVIGPFTSKTSDIGLRSTSVCHWHSKSWMFNIFQILNVMFITSKNSDALNGFFDIQTVVEMRSNFYSMKKPFLPMNKNKR